MEPITFVKLAIRHHLLHVTLRHALLGILHTGGDPLPFRVDNLHDLVAALDQDVQPRLEQATSIFGFEAVEPSTLADDTEICIHQHTLQHSSDIFLEQGVHLEQQREAVAATGRGRLEPLTKQEASEIEQLAPAAIGPIRHDLVPA